MFIDRKALIPETALPIAQLRESCMGCKDCKGTCMELVQMCLLPEILIDNREART